MNFTALLFDFQLQYEVSYVTTPTIKYMRKLTNVGDGNEFVFYGLSMFIDGRKPNPDKKK